MLFRLSSFCLLVISVLAGSSLNADATRALSGKSAVDYLKRAGRFDRLKAAVEASRYEINQANDPAQTLLVSSTRNGVEIGSSQQSWRMGMKLAGIGYGQKLRNISTGSARVNGNRIEIPHSSVTEWYVNKPEGIEQGFTVTQRPGVGLDGNPLRVALKITGKLRARLEEGGKAAILERMDGSHVVRYDHLAAFDNKGRSLRAWMEASEGQLTLLVDDSNADYPLSIDPLFTLVKQVTGSDTTAGDWFGGSVAISGNTIVVGAPYDDADRGSSAYVFEWDSGGNGNWGQVKKLTASDGAAGNGFGYFTGVAISDNTIVVAAGSADNFRGAAYVFQRNRGGANNWGEVTKLTASPRRVNGLFGQSVGIRGDTAVVAGSGDAFVFGRDEGGNNNWGMVKRLTSSDGGDFGKSVSISGNTIVVGTEFGGRVFLFYRNRGGSDNWGEVKKIIGSGQFGWSHAISGDTMVVGTDLGDGAWIYGRDEGGTDNWGLIKQLSASDSPPDNGFGYSVGISGSIVVVGASSHYVVHPGKAAYIFRRNKGGADNWGQAQKLTGSTVSFGQSVGISGFRVVVGESDGESASIFSTPLSITAQPVPVIAGLPPATTRIAHVGDPDQALDTLTVKVNGQASATANGVTVSNIVVGPKGAVTARVGATCGATNASFTLAVTNNAGATETDTLNVTVSDGAPTLTLKPSTQMWPPNGRYGTITVNDMVASVSDVCSTFLNVNDVKIEKVTSDEPDDTHDDADGNTTNDIVIEADCESVRLRSERDTTKNGRVYSITLFVRDKSGNTTRQVYRVGVPNHFLIPAVLDPPALTVLSSCQ